MYYTTVLQLLNIIYIYCGMYICTYILYIFIFLAFSLLEFTEMCMGWQINEEDPFWQIAVRSNWTKVYKGLSAVPDV